MKSIFTNTDFSDKLVFMEQTLISAGLSKLQARAYLYLLELGSSAPKNLADKLATTRTNTYKVLESLDAIGLVYRSELNKKVIYTPADPSALSALLADKRNSIIALETHVNEAMDNLRRKYGRNTSLSVSSFAGKQAIVDAYESQSQKGEPIYFVKARSDIPFMGYEMMSSIRIKQSNNVKRYGITQDTPESKMASNINLDRTWIEESEYTAPIEWSVAGDELIIQIFDGNGSVIKIQNQLVADSFRQIWSFSNSALISNPSYKNMPIKARKPKDTQD